MSPLHLVNTKLIDSRVVEYVPMESPAICFALLLLHTWSAELCNADSDEDGRTNGEELGDPDCQWSVGR